MRADPSTADEPRFRRLNRHCRTHSLKMHADREDSLTARNAALQSRIRRGGFPTAQERSVNRSAAVGKPPLRRSGDVEGGLSSTKLLATKRHENAQKNRGLFLRLFVPFCGQNRSSQPAYIFRDSETAFSRDCARKKWVRSHRNTGGFHHKDLSACEHAQADTEAQRPSPRPRIRCLALCLSVPACQAAGRSVVKLFGNAVKH